MHTSKQSKLYLAVSVILGLCTSGSVAYAGQQSPLDPYTTPGPATTKINPVLPNSAVAEPQTTYVTIPIKDDGGDHQPFKMKDGNSGKLIPHFNLLGDKSKAAKEEKVKPDKMAKAAKPPKPEKAPKETKIGEEIKLKSDKHKSSIANGVKIDKSLQASSPSPKTLDKDKDNENPAGNGVKVGDNSSGKLLGGTKAAGNKIVDGGKEAGSKIVDGSKAASSKLVNGGKAAGSKIVDGSKSLGEDVASGTKKVGTGIKSGAKASGDLFVKGARAIGDGFKGTGEKLKEGTDGLGSKMSAVPHMFSKDKKPGNESLAKNDQKSDLKTDANKTKPAKLEKAQAGTAQYIAGGKPVKGGKPSSDTTDKKGLMSKTLGVLPFIGSKKSKGEPAPAVAGAANHQGAVSAPGAADLSQSRPLPLVSPATPNQADPARTTVSSTPTNSL
jgi:hypothetical protein